MILPADQKTTIQETKCIDDEHSPLDTQPTTFIDGTPLKLGQPEIKFTWDNNKGLQAFAKDPEMGTATAYIPVKLPTIIKPGNENKPIILNQLNKVQAEFVARNFKWEVTREGVLQENGVRLRGGGKEVEVDGVAKVGGVIVGNGMIVGKNQLQQHGQVNHGNQ